MNLRVDRSSNTHCIISIKLANWEIELLKVDCALSALLIHTRFDVMQLRGWNKFRGLCVDCNVKISQSTVQHNTDKISVARKNLFTDIHHEVLYIVSTRDAHNKDLCQVVQCS